jgi:transcriptional regulator with XRE-family HTH domain
MTAADVRALRVALRCTQEELATAIGVGVSIVNRWENGHARPSPLAARALQAVARQVPTVAGLDATSAAPVMRPFAPDAIEDVCDRRDGRRSETGHP